MSDQIIQELNRREAREEEMPQFNPGDTIAVHVRVVEGSKERIQVFKGIVIAINGRGGNRKFTVRKLSSGVGVERVFPVNSPSIAKIEVEKEGDVRRSKLYYLRDRVGKKARVREKEQPRMDEAQRAEAKKAKEEAKAAKIAAKKEKRQASKAKNAAEPKKKAAPKKKADAE